MELLGGIGEKSIKEVIEEHPKIGEILNNYEIGCIECSIGTCQFKEVVKIHFLGDKIEQQIEKEVNEYLKSII
ncbi:MAG TPA: hypothetical protein EYP35_02350 [Desulfobacterales bacterium]|nr:hypothetical protein [Desulfobacterales bacterium]